jgi:hypothetical protein
MLSQHTNPKQHGNLTNLIFFLQKKEVYKSDKGRTSLRMDTTVAETYACMRLTIFVK